MLNVKQGGIKYHFLSLWYDSTWDWTQVFWAIGELSNDYANVWLFHTLPKYALILINQINLLFYFTTLDEGKWKAILKIKR